MPALVVLETNLELADGFVRGPNGFYSMAAEIVRGMFHVLPGPAERGNSLTDLGMVFGRICRRGYGKGEREQNNCPRK